MQKKSVLRKELAKAISLRNRFEKMLNMIMKTRNKWADRITRLTGEIILEEGLLLGSWKFESLTGECITLWQPKIKSQRYKILRDLVGREGSGLTVHYGKNEVFVYLNAEGRIKLSISTSDFDRVRKRINITDFDTTELDREIRQRTSELDDMKSIRKFLKGEKK